MIYILLNSLLAHCDVYVLQGLKVLIIGTTATIHIPNISTVEQLLNAVKVPVNIDPHTTGFYVKVGLKCHVPCSCWGASPMMNAAVSPSSSAESLSQ